MSQKPISRERFMGLKKRRGRGGEIFPLSSPPLPLSHPSSLSICFVVVKIAAAINVPLSFH